MQQLTHAEFSNWVALYVATGLCCAIAFALAAAKTAIDIYQESSWASVQSFGSLVLFVPKTWWRWQKNYLASTPVTLGVVSLFAASMSWS
ncbi:hypothetical protein [Sphingobium algorifonticola]|jgi:hypothetical protein|uniref:Uncharacterized protein n=1 Tax=Sphingobium algorifonticola TaxID=2008318 RepID=A0A437J4P3_9SPHN|nr:hypothetical protein [Sphingobium algorifonticola]RVT39616.1 hypothetical protein ENE74_14740 [Sphingobium algorifonticola]